MEDISICNGISYSLWQQYGTGKIGSLKIGTSSKYPERMGENYGGPSSKNLTDAELGAVELGLLICVNACLELAFREFAVQEYEEQVEHCGRNLKDFENDIYSFLIKKSMYPVVECGVRYRYMSKTRGGVHKEWWGPDIDSAHLYDADWLETNEASPYAFFENDVHTLFGSHKDKSWWYEKVNENVRIISDQYYSDSEPRWLDFSTFGIRKIYGNLTCDF